MIEFGHYSLMAATAMTAAALLGYLVLFTGHRTAAERPVKDTSTIITPSVPVKQKANSVSQISSLLAQCALATMTVALLCRMIAVKHAPFSNQYEFASSFIWGILLAYVAFELKYHVKSLAIFALPVALAGQFYAILTLDHTPDSLLPALQNHTLLTLHVIAAVLAYGAACVSSAAAMLYLLKPHVKWRGIPSLEVLDDIGYRGIVVFFPLQTLMLILGALWADIAWGHYWSWDPKETAALVTWLIYGAYLHARVTRGWQGKRSAWLLILGFGAVLFTFLGNHFFGGLHTYA